MPPAVDVSAALSLAFCGRSWHGTLCPIIAQFVGVGKSCFPLIKGEYALAVGANGDDRTEATNTA